ncbi:MAG: glycoside hydrolase family 76 protein [Chitinophagaceae bacterium]
MHYKQFLILLAALCITVLSSAQPADYKARIDVLYKNIQQHLKDSATGLYLETTNIAKNENPHSWLWPLCALVQAANEMEVLEPNKHYLQPVAKVIDQYYNDKAPSPAYQDYVTKERQSSRFYDDNEWVAIAYLDAYKRNHKKEYLDKALMIYRFIATGIDTAAGGGMYWKEGDITTKNTCSNGPGVLVALQLYQLTKDKAYLDTAMSLYEWTNIHLQAPDGLFYDAIKIPSLNINKQKYTYNTGTMLQSNVLLYEFTHEKRFLVEAQSIAGAGKQYFYQNKKLPGEYWFNAVLLRGYIELYKIDKNKEWIEFFAEDADRTWNTERDDAGFVGNKSSQRLIDQAAMIEIYARLLQLQQVK